MRYLTIVFCLMCLFTVPLIADCSSADKKALEDFDRAWGAASTSGDRAALEQIYASDYMGTSPGATENHAQTIDNTMRAFERQKGAPQPAVVYDHYIISCTPVTAMITHRNTVTTTEDGKSETFYTRSVHFLEKRAGRWQVVGNAGGPLSDTAQVAYLEEDWNTADMKNDVAWFEKNYASDLTSISSRTGAITNKREELAAMRSRKDTTTFAEISDLNTHKEGDTVIASGINHVKGTDAMGKAFDRRIAYTDVWVKRDGRWQVLATQGTEIR
jgi:ketosteroid isomerase-like protein